MAHYKNFSSPTKYFTATYPGAKPNPYTWTNGHMKREGCSREDAEDAYLALKPTLHSICRVEGVPYGQVWKIKKREGCSDLAAIELFKSLPEEDKVPTHQSLADASGVSCSRVRATAKRQGISFEEALEVQVVERVKKGFTLGGMYFATRGEAEGYFGKSFPFCRRLSREGLSAEEIKLHGLYKGYKSIAAYMKEFHGSKGYGVISSTRFKTKCTWEQAETKYIWRVRDGIKEGIHVAKGCFITKRDVLECYGKNESTVRDTAERWNIPFEEAIDRIPLKREEYTPGTIPCTVAGIDFDSTKAAEEYFGRGKESVEYLLGLGVRIEHIPSYTNLEDYCNRWGVGITSVKGWRKKGYTLRGAIAKVLLVKRVQCRGSSKFNPRKRALRSCFGKSKRYQCTPKWLTGEERSLMVDMYEEAKVLEGMSVDHIIPLNGEFVSGLHVLSNLQIISLDENMDKGNLHDLE